MSEYRFEMILNGIYSIHFYLYIFFTIEHIPLSKLSTHMQYVYTKNFILNIFSSDSQTIWVKPDQFEELENE